MQRKILALLTVDRQGRRRREESIGPRHRAPTREPRMPSRRWGNLSRFGRAPRNPRCAQINSASGSVNLARKSARCFVVPGKPREGVRAARRAAAARADGSGASGSAGQRAVPTAALGRPYRAGPDVVTTHDSANGRTPLLRSDRPEGRSLVVLERQPAVEKSTPLKFRNLHLQRRFARLSWKCRRRQEALNKGERLKGIGMRREPPCLAPYARR